MSEDETFWKLKTGAIVQRMNEVIVLISKSDHNFDVLDLMAENRKLMAELMECQEAEIASLKAAYKDTDE